MTPALRAATKPAAVLLGFALFGSALLSGTFAQTRERIEQTERAAKIALIAQTRPPGSFDNDPVRASRALPLDPRLGLRRPGQAYLATRAGQPVAVVLEAAAPDGYAGEIKLLVGILGDGRLAGVRVTAHRETPGLGDYIDVTRSDWIHQFAGKSLANPDPADWKVRKDGGQFDYMAGATITPRAIVKAVRNVLEFHADHRTQLLAPATASLAGEKPGAPR